MLVSFSVENYRCFRDRVTLDMRVPRRAAPGSRPWDGNLQPVAAIYGANASGKTALVRALRDMINDVGNSYRRSRVCDNPFLFDEASSERATAFAVQFIASDKTCYAYGYSTFRGAVTAEWAERYTTSRARVLFERQGQEIKFGKALRGPNEAVKRTLGSSNLYLSAAMAAKHEGLAPLYEWFSDEIEVYALRDDLYSRRMAMDDMADDTELRSRIGSFLSRADVGLAGLQFESKRLTEKERSDSELIEFFFPEDSDVDFLAGSNHEVAVRAFGSHNIDGKEYRLPLREESEGTRALIGHAFIADTAIRKGSTIVFDEIDASLHPLIVRELVRVFTDPQLNPDQAQLIFTTHDVSLMDTSYLDGSVLTRDQVWVADKDMRGVSTLDPLTARGARTRDNLASRYLTGRYGGVPAPLPLLDPTLG